MDTIDNIMKLAYELRYARTYEWDVSDAVEAGEALRTALTELVSTATEYQQAADKMAMEHKVERDTLRQQLAEAQALIDAEPDKQLCKFYNVQTFPELVEQMERHIRKLQSQLPIRKVFTNSKVREG